MMTTRARPKVKYRDQMHEQHRNTNAGEGDAMRWQRQRRVPSKIYKNQRKHWELKEPSPWRSKSGCQGILNCVASLCRKVSEPWRSAKREDEEQEVSFE
nr:uncharacterized protein LOC108005500 [Drosophila suzukii]